MNNEQWEFIRRGGAPSGAANADAKGGGCKSSNAPPGASSAAAECRQALQIFKSFSTFPKNPYIRIMLNYPVKILVAFAETFSGNVELHEWLLRNGYAELAALSSAIRGSEEAFKWLMMNGYPELAALDAAIDENQRAYDWLNHHKHFFLAVLADACNNKPDAIAWLTKNDLQIFLMIATKIRFFRDNQTFDYHKIHF